MKIVVAFWTFEISPVDANEREMFVTISILVWNIFFSVDDERQRWQMTSTYKLDGLIE